MINRYKHKSVEFKPCKNCSIPSSCANKSPKFTCAFELLDENEKTRLAESKVSKFIQEKFNISEGEVLAMTIQNKMSFVNMRDSQKWEEFKIDLRKVGYII